MTRWLLRSILLLAAVAGPEMSVASPPARFNYQAKLADSDGTPLDGVHTLYFTLYQGGSAGVANSGSAVFAENAAVTATDGVVSHPVGTGTNTLGGSLTPAMFDFAGDIHLQVAIDTIGNVVLPRTRLDSVPFALSTTPAAADGVPPGGIIAAEPGTTFTGFTPLGMGFHSTGQWLVRADMPTTRSKMTAAEANGRIYVMGGYLSSGVFAVTGANEEYDPVSNTWATKAPIPTGRLGHTATTVAGKIHVMGGATSPFSLAGTIAHNTYDPLADDWDPAPDMPSARCFMAATAVETHIYVFGGYDGAGAAQNTNLVFDTGTNAWGPAKASLPAATVLQVAGTLNGNAIMVGGSSQAVGLATAYRYSPVANAWTQLQSAPVPLQNAASAVAGNIFFVIGAAAESPGGGTTGVFAYDPVADEWRSKAILPSPHEQGAAAPAGNRIYHFGGIANGNMQLRDTLELNPGVFTLHQKN